MKSHRIGVLATKTYALVIALVLALPGAAVLIGHELRVEEGEAATLVRSGRGALARSDHASATLAFERARLLAPRAAFVRSALADDGEPDGRLSAARAARWVTPREWCWLSVLSGWSLGLSLVFISFDASGAREARSGRGRTARRLALSSGAAFVLTMAGVVQSTLTARDLAVVTTPAGALISPYESAAAAADLHAGAVVVTGERYGDFVQVKAAGDVRGWVGSTNLQAVVGPSA